MNVSKAEASVIGTKATLNIDRETLEMTGTYATFAQILALQSQEIVSHDIFGNNFTNVEINMRFITSLFMTGAIVFRSGEEYKSCASELRRIAGKFRKSICQVIKENWYISGWGRGNSSCFASLLKRGSTLKGKDLLPLGTIVSLFSF